MIPRIPRNNSWLVSFSILLAAAMLSGCSKSGSSGPSKDVSSSAFDSAPAEIKQSWSDAMGAWKNHRYADAAPNFVSLRAMAGALSIEQSNAVSRAFDEFGQAAYAAANKGDAGAIEAVKTLRGGSGRRGAAPAR